MSKPRSEDTAFTSNWNQASAWAQSNGIAVDSLIPVYQEDLSRLQNGETAMSTAERYRAIIAANNPNDVTPASSDTPKPSAIFANTRSDAASIFTGLMPNYLIEGAVDTLKNTWDGFTDPHRYQGKQIGTTLSNWLTQTMLSWVPGAYDIGVILKADPTLSNDAGAKALLEHPLVSLLDVAPGLDEASGFLAKTAVGGRLAEAAGMSTEQAEHAGIVKTLTNAVGNVKTGKTGIAADSAAKGIQTDLSVGDTINNWLGNSKLGTSTPIRNFVGSYFDLNQATTVLYQNYLAQAHDAVTALSEDDRKVLDQIYNDNKTKGKSIRELENQPGVSEAVRNAISRLDKVRQWETRKALASGDVVPIRRPDGSVGYYSARGHKAVRNAYDQLAKDRELFVKYMSEDDALQNAYAKLEHDQPRLVGNLETALKNVQDCINSDDDLVNNVTETFQPATKTARGKEKKPETLTLGSRRRAALEVFGPNGTVSYVLRALKNDDEAGIAEGLRSLKQQLRSWGIDSVDEKDLPYVQEVTDLVDQLDRYQKAKREINERIDKSIVGDHRASKDEVKSNQEFYIQARRDVQERRRMETEKFNADIRRKRGEYRVKYKRKMQDIENEAAYRIRMALEMAHNKEMADGPALRQKTWRGYYNEFVKAKNQINAETRLKIQIAKRDMEVAKLKVDKEKADAVAKMKADRLKEDAELKDNAETGKEFVGQMYEYMKQYVESVKKFEKAISDHPGDEFSNALLDIYITKLMDALDEESRNKVLQGIADRIDRQKKRDSVTTKLKDKARTAVTKDDTLDRLRDNLQTNPDIMRELVTLHFDEVLNNPDAFDSETYDMVKEIRDNCIQSAKDELNVLIAQGFRPEWFPSAQELDRVVASIEAPVGRGVPHVDVAFQRAMKLSNTRHDVVLGITKAAAQRLTKDSYISFVENDILPRTIKGADLKDQILGLKLDADFAGVDLTAKTLPAHITKELAEYGLTRVDPQALFGFTMPRWENDALFMPSSLVRALQRSREVSESTGVLDKTDNVFRYSILGLSPRYTAHVTFGGTMLLALRSTPYLATMLKTTHDAMKAGDIPDAAFRHPTQEGWERFHSAMTANDKEVLGKFHEAAGMQLGHLAIQEYIEKKLGIPLGKANPFHYLKAVADLNFKFTRYVSRLQKAMAYMDYYAKAQREGSFVDPETGVEMPMTKERAMHEGVQHAKDVFGDLHNMSPIERQAAKSIFPFYGWQRHIIQYVLTFPFDHPYRAMMLGLIAYENSADVPKGLYERIQFMFFLGSPDKQGNVSGIDMRFMDPLRDVANYASLTGWLQSLNPAILAPLAMLQPNIVYGSNTLYPNLTYNQLYGDVQAGDQGNLMTGLEQFIPQTGALDSALQIVGNVRKLRTNPNAFYKSIYESLNIPFAQVQKLNLKQIAVNTELARYRVAEQDSTNAFDTGDFSSISNYASVPYPLNPDYEVTPKQLEQIYNQALQEYPGQNPADVLLPPPTPPGM